MKNFWTDTIKRIYFQWGEEEPVLLADNVEKLIMTLGPGAGRYKWVDAKAGKSLEWKFDPDASFCYSYNDGPDEVWDWELSNGEWQDDNSFVIVLEQDGDALVFGDHFLIFLEEEWKNGVI